MGRSVGPGETSARGPVTSGRAAKATAVVDGEKIFCCRGNPDPLCDTGRGRPRAHSGRTYRCRGEHGGSRRAPWRHECVRSIAPTSWPRRAAAHHPPQQVVLAYSVRHSWALLGSPPPAEVERLSERRELAHPGRSMGLELLNSTLSFEQWHC